MTREGPPGAIPLATSSTSARVKGDACTMIAWIRLRLFLCIYDIGWALANWALPEITEAYEDEER